MPINVNRKPLIILTGANDEDEYRKGVNQELGGVDTILSSCREELGYEVKYISYSKINELSKYLLENIDRCIIFHFSGHASSEYLKLDDGLMFIDGLLDLFEKSKTIQLVFLNGCSTADFIENLLSKYRIEYTLIGNRNQIDDPIAKDLGSLFYTLLEEGKYPISEVIKKVESGIKLKYKKPKDFSKGDLDKDANWRWFSQSGNDNWYLKDSAGPCFQLPQLPINDLPSKPYKNLSFYTEDDAEIFFGRCVPLLELFSYLKSSESIILLYGQTGVGKSSFLSSGLIPRLKADDQDVLYYRYSSSDMTENSILDNVLNDKDHLKSWKDAAAARRSHRCRVLAAAVVV